MFFSKVKANQKCSLPKANQNCFSKAKADQKRFFDALTKRNWAGSKAFSHASASCDYMSLPILAGSKVGTPCSPKIDHSFQINLINQTNLTCVIEPDGSIVHK